jgi:hypothetical protein
MEPSKLQDLLDRAARGDGEARRELRNATGGRFENKPVEDVPPMLRGAYARPDPASPVSLEELREAREYDRKVVDDFVNKACDPNFLPPGAAMIMFCVMCTKFHSAFQMFGNLSGARSKMMQLYNFWDEAHPWVKANILYEMRERLYQEHHLTFCRGFFQAARRYDQIVEDGEAAREAMQHTKEVTNGSREDNQKDEP